MRIDRIIIMTAVLAFAFAASACIFSPSQDEVGSKKMQIEMQASSLGSEEDAGVDAEAEAEAEAEADAEAEAKVEAEDRAADEGVDTSRARENIPPLEVTNPFRPIGGRENIPISIGDISIILYPDPVDATAILGGSYEQQFTAWASGNPNMYFAWTVTGLPAGWNYSIGGSYWQILTIDETPTVAGTYPITVKAAQYSDSTNFGEYSYTLVVSAQGEEEEEEEDGDCSVPISLEIVRIYNGQAELNPSNDAYPVFLGSRGHEIKVKVSGGKKPYTFTWSSAMKDTHKCWKKGAVSQEKEYWTWVPADKKTCDTDDYNYSSPSWTQNLSWKPVGDVEMHQVPISDFDQMSEPRAYYAETDSNYLTLKGDMVFTDPMSGVQGPLPYIPGKYSSVADDLDLIPEDEFTVSVKGSCDDGDRTNAASKTITYKIKHHEDKLEDAKIKLFYKDAATSNKATLDADPPNCTVDQCHMFEKSHIMFFFMGDNETTVDDIYIEDDPDSENNGDLIYGDVIIRHGYIDDIFDHANSYARFKMKSLADGDGVVEKDFYRIDETSTVLDARHLYLRLDTPSKVSDGALWTDDHNYDNLDITRIEIETDQWVMVAQDVSDPWSWDGTQLYDYLKLFKVSGVTKNSNGGLFRRKNWTYYPLY